MLGLAVIAAIGVARATALAIAGALTAPIPTLATTTATVLALFIIVIATLPRNRREPPERIIAIRIGAALAATAAATALGQLERQRISVGYRLALIVVRPVATALATLATLTALRFWLAAALITTVIPALAPTLIATLAFTLAWRTLFTSSGLRGGWAGFALAFTRTTTTTAAITFALLFVFATRSGRRAFTRSSRFGCWATAALLLLALGFGFLLRRDFRDFVRIHTGIKHGLLLGFQRFGIGFIPAFGRA